MNKELKRQIKQDDLKTGIVHAAEWVSGHRDEARMVLIAVAVLILGAIGLSAYRSHRQASADRAFNEAFEIFHAPVAGDAEAAAGAKVYGSAAEKHQKAAEAFRAIHDRFGGTSTGRRARYYAALSQIELGSADKAEADLRELSSGNEGELVSGLARLALADLHRQRAQWDQAIDLYRKLADGSAAGVPRDHALMRLATALEESSRVKEAGTSYRRIADEFPSSVYAAEARRRAESLESRG